MWRYVINQTLFSLRISFYILGSFSPSRSLNHASCLYTWLRCSSFWRRRWYWNDFHFIERNNCWKNIYRKSEVKFEFVQTQEKNKQSNKRGLNQNRWSCFPWRRLWGEASALEKPKAIKSYLSFLSFQSASPESRLCWILKHESTRAFRRSSQSQKAGKLCIIFATAAFPSHSSRKAEASIFN